jgi:hypothetical protein
LLAIILSSLLLLLSEKQTREGGSNERKMEYPLYRKRDPVKYVGSSETLIGWKSGKITLWDRMEGVGMGSVE